MYSGSSLECNRTRPITRLYLCVFFILLIVIFFIISILVSSLPSVSSKINLKTEKDIITNVFTTKIPQFVTQYNRISKIYVYLHFTFFFSSLSSPISSPPPYFTSTSTSHFQRLQFSWITTESFVEREPSHRRLPDNKIIVKYWHHLYGISTVVIHLLCHIFKTSNLELPSYPLASSQSMTKNLEQSVFKV